MSSPKFTLVFRCLAFFRLHSTICVKSMISILFTHFVLISLVFVVVATHHIDVIVAFIGNSAKPFNDDDAIAQMLFVCSRGGGDRRYHYSGDDIAEICQQRRDL